MSLYESFKSAVKPKGRRATWHPLQFVEAWHEFVAEAMAGFSGDLYEYENELTVSNGFVNSIQDQDDGLIQDHRRIGE